MRDKTLECDILVIGSGPGGAMTACLLAEAGEDVILVEEGSNLPLESAESYSLEEMNQKYRNGGLSPALGATKVTFLEGRCVGGASEINAALYHRPLPETLREWAVKYQLDGMDAESMDEHFTAIEDELSVSVARDGIGPAAAKLKEGADSLGWRVNEVRRFWKYDKDDDGDWIGRRQSMTETLVPRAVAAGCRLVPDTWIQRISVGGQKAKFAHGFSTTARGRGQGVRVHFKDVFLCAGAVQSPVLLRRSGIKEGVGDSLRMHPMLRVVARFDEKVNDPSFGVPVQQVEEFKPHLTLGCSHSSLPHLALWLAGDVNSKSELLSQWERVAIFYVAVTGSSLGKVRNVPIFDEPLVTYPLGNRDLSLLGEGIYRLGELLFRAGCREIFGPVEGVAPTRNTSQLASLRTGLPQGRMNVSAIHLFCSLPMGADMRSSRVGPWGRLHGFDNIYVNDGSILPGTPGVNPQGTIMAIARRNAVRYLDS